MKTLDKDQKEYMYDFALKHIYDIYYKNESRTPKDELRQRIRLKMKYIQSLIDKS